MTPASTVPVTGAWRAGRSGRAPPVRDAVRRRVRTCSRRADASRRSPSRTRRGGRSTRDASNAVLVLHALTGDSHAAGPAEPGPRRGRVVGRRSIGPGPRDRHRPVLRRVPQRARRLPGHDRSGVDRSRRPARRTARASRSITIRDQVAVEAALADALGIERWAAVVGGSMGGQRALEWAVDVSRAGAARGDHRVRRARRRPRRSRCARCRSARSRPTRTSTAATTTTPTRRSVARHVARARHRPGQLPDRARVRRAVRPRPPGRRAPVRGRAYTIESYLEYHGEKLARRFDANTYIVLSRAMNHHDVGRGRGGIARRARRASPAEVTIAGISSDRLYPLRLQHELAELIPRQLRASHVIDSIVGPRRLPHRERGGRQDHRRCARVLLDHVR